MKAPNFRFICVFSKYLNLQRSSQICKSSWTCHIKWFFFFVITWILLTHALQKWMQEGLFCFHARVSIPTSQGDKVLWYKTFFFFSSTKCLHITEADMFVLWDTKRLVNPIDALFLVIGKAFKCLLQNIVLSCLFDLNSCK